MLYTDRKKTPLKFNWVLKVVLPISFVISVYNLYDLICTLFFENQNSNLAIGMNSAGYSMQNMGIFFWPVIINVICLTIETILLFYASVGLWKWKTFGPKAIVLYNLFGVVQSVYLLVLIRINPTYVNALINMVDGSSLLSINTVTLIYTMTYVIVSLYYAILSICTFLYYKKRKLLFDEYYMQPQTDTIYEETVIQQVDSTVVEDVENNAEFQPYYCTECGTKITDENTQYCPNCGKKLK